MEIGIEQARKPLGDIANRVHLTQETVYLTRNGRRVAAITPLGHIEETKETSVSATTTNYGSWVSIGGGFLTIEDSVRGALGEDAGAFDGDGLVDAYRAAIDAALPEEISINGSEFYGPYPAPADATDPVRSAGPSPDLWM